MILRDVPGLPAPELRPPIVAESGDPFAELRVVHLLARIPRGEPVRIRDVVDRLNAEQLDWSFSRSVVIAAARWSAWSGAVASVCAPSPWRRERSPDAAGAPDATLTPPDGKAVRHRQRTSKREERPRCRPTRPRPPS
jgi:hypothetical protein